MCGTSTAGPDEFAIATLPNGWQVGRFPALAGEGGFAGLAHVVTTRVGLDAGVARSDRSAAAAQVADAMGLEGVAFCHQVHGPAVVRVDAAGLAGDGDALLTGRPGLGVMGFSADCPLVLVADPAGPAVGVAHASWRSTVQRITARLIEAMAGQLGAPPERLVACVCPSAGPCCYEVGGEVVQAAVDALGLGAERFFRERAGGGGKFLFDLWAANRDQLIRAGVRKQNVHVAGVCTICRNDLFPSYRVEGPSAGRFVAVIGRVGGWSGAGVENPAAFG